MARVRRKPSVTTRWNYEIAGIIALGIAILLAVSLIVFAAFLPVAFGQSAPSYKWEGGFGYNFLHTNAPPAQCGCFDMNGGTASVAYHVKTTGPDRLLAQIT